MSARFTPGPWKASYDGVTIYSDTRTAWKVALALSGMQPGERPSEPVAKANARLIAAAPALFEAAERALNYIENTEGELGITLESGEMLRAAISLVTGEDGK